ncbi:hypothetical protein A4A49_32393 [Nicotiana attenuata]|uniref:Uncharacterized protein n=1 Tax=Nicotiana attenuata TaxID=49451 RepID=A0A1J6IV29_NICAT|nr:hypothetical protein A4A49_32393 [Nicotiana attenuata]
MEYDQPKKIVEELAVEYYQLFAMCFKCGGNHIWVDCQAGRYFSYGSYFEQSHSVSSSYRYENSYGHNLDSGWDEYPYYSESEVRQPPQGENDSLEELVYKFINKLVESFTQDEEAMNNLTMQESQIISTLSESSLRCDGEYMEEMSCENEPTQEDEHPQRELFTVQDDSGSTEMIENKVVVECEEMEEEFKPSTTFPHLQHVVEENEKQMVLDIPEEYSLDLSSLFSYSNIDHVDFIFGDLQEYVWTDPMKECKNKLRMIMNEQFTARDEDKKKGKEWV